MPAYSPKFNYRCSLNVVVCYVFSYSVFLITAELVLLMSFVNHHVGQYFSVKAEETGYS